jgi:hypothetical protein
VNVTLKNESIALTGLQFWWYRVVVMVLQNNGFGVTECYRVTVFVVK